MTRAYGAIWPALAAGAVLALLAMPVLAPALVGSLAGAEPKAAWYLARATGLCAYGLAWLAMMAGLALSTRAARRWPGPAVTLALHRDLSVLSLAFAALHALVLLGDRWAGFDLWAIALPFAAPLRPAAVAAGQVALYLGAAVAGSFAVRRDLGPRAWRALHVASFGVFALALVHGLTAGTDARTPAMLAFYLLTGASVVFPTAYRLAFRR